MKLKSILAGSFKLDGGAMFGVVPKKIWEKLVSADNQNLCSWALRCLYIEHGDKKILIDTGLGNKQNPRFFSHYEPSGDILIQHALENNQIHPEDITDVILTHMHFDHIGGALFKNENGETQFSFPNAIYWSNKEHLEHALNPNAREKASFLPENILPLIESNKLQFLEDTVFDKLEFIKLEGHTRSMMLPIINYGDRKLLFSADLFPSVHHLAMPYIMAYDIQPLITLKEKETVLNRCLDENIDLFFEHDMDHEIAILKRNENGKAVVESTSTLEAWLKIQ